MEKPIQAAFCRLCGCWRGSLGLEPTASLYIEHLVGICGQVKRVLRDDGTFWCNISGSFQDKQWVAIPWMLGMALQKDGWWLRSPIIWAKGLSFCETYSGSVMPESVSDRPTTSYEYLLLLTKSKRYFYDQNAVREAHEGNSGWAKQRQKGTAKPRKSAKTMGMLSGERTDPSRYKVAKEHPAGRNLRSVWAIPEQLYSLRGDLDAETKARVVSELVQRGLL